MYCTMQVGQPCSGHENSPLGNHLKKKWFLSFPLIQITVDATSAACTISVYRSDMALAMPLESALLPVAGTSSCWFCLRSPSLGF
ncbi:hypothetical protein H2248_012596 [Termitomyces sp. 'cryptogamus']|nr:hypothetical protein H2248_012596 [Termitomyces sp. 'cryptogamus']